MCRTDLDPHDIQETRRRDALLICGRRAPAAKLASPVRSAAANPAVCKDDARMLVAVTQCDRNYADMLAPRRVPRRDGARA